MTTMSVHQALESARIDAFKARIRGEVLLPDDPGYDGTRQIWNAMIDRAPALIARCTSSEDVVQAVDFARRHNLLVSIRGGGHNIAGHAVCDGGLMIDLSPMKRVQVDPHTRRATVEPGCLLADVDAATQAQGLATPLGINSTTGVAGLTLGGGLGYLARRCGLACDNLSSADVDTADGRLLTCWSGPSSEDEALRERLEGLGPVLGQHVQRMPYPVINTLFDELLPAGLHHYWQGCFTRQLTDEAIAVHIDHGSRIPCLQTATLLFPIDGACRRVAPEATAFAYRDASFATVLGLSWPDPADSERNIAWGAPTIKRCSLTRRRAAM